MKTLSKTLAVFTTFAVFLACENNPPLALDESSDSDKGGSSNEMPIMSEKVISYQRVNNVEYDSIGRNNFGGLTNDRDILKQWFPHIFGPHISGTKLEDSECNYFALYFVESDFNYKILQDKTLYYMKPEYGEGCIETTDMRYNAMLVCDDKTGTLQEGINLKLFSLRYYTVPDWDCREERSQDKYPYF